MNNTNKTLVIFTWLLKAFAITCFIGLIIGLIGE
jgi:hypothetical protein